MMAWLRRALRVVVTVIGIAVVAWLLAEGAPGSTAERAARVAGVLPADDSAVSEATREMIIDSTAQRYDLERSVPSRIIGYVGGLAVGDFGVSWRDGSPVSAKLGAATTTTGLLVLLALLAAAAAGIGFAVASARSPASRFDIAIGAIGALAISLPPVWIGLLLVRTFALGRPFSWFDYGGSSASLLPVLTLALVPAFVLARPARWALISAAAEPWATAATARGVSRSRLISVHCLRASAPTLIVLFPILVAYALGAAVVIENLFGIDGLGALVLDASARGDAPVVVGVAVVAAIFVALASMVADVASGALDPRRGDGA
jgi:peptide/nickel transport system permease protein